MFSVRRQVIEVIDVFIHSTSIESLTNVCGFMTYFKTLPLTIAEKQKLLDDCLDDFNLPHPDYKLSLLKCVFKLTLEAGAGGVPGKPLRAENRSFVP
jgi:hypothetical protein